jgi:hypothetical protein
VAGIAAETAFVRWQSDARWALIREPGSKVDDMSNVRGSGDPGDVWWLPASIEVSPTSAMAVTHVSLRSVFSTRICSQTRTRQPTSNAEINAKFDYEEE